jgi:putative flippase GtrA
MTSPGRHALPQSGCANGMLRRWLAFNAVGGMGVAVQLAALSILTGRMGLNYLTGTALAVEASILHNFVWHVRWTWADRSPNSGWGLFKRFSCFNLSTGALSIAGNLLAMRFFAGVLKMAYLPANLLAIACCAILNFLASDRFVFSCRRAEGSMDRQGG